jgi:hypothetical protein
LGASSTAVTTPSQHHKYEQKKFAISGTRANVFANLVLTIDHLGGLGTVGYWFLFSPDCWTKRFVPQNTRRPRTVTEE